MPLDLDAKKAVLRSFTYGLYAVSAGHDGERGIFTANWLTQVSFDPPLVALSVERDSATLKLIRASGRFVVTPLRSDQRELAGDLGRPRARAGDKFAVYDLPAKRTASGDPVFDGGLGYCVCAVQSETAAGDSVVFIGEVIEAQVGEPGDPLTMRDAGFRHAG
jgi:flavin reductase (DIM6/NTAB) family NADH-FMN oxidoreductase RutF